MTTFQLVASLVFVLALVAAYGNDLLAAVKLWVARQPDPDSPPPSIAVGLVEELIAVTELRDKLAAENCLEGVEACTTLLRVIVEHQQPTRGEV